MYPLILLMCSIDTEVGRVNLDLANTNPSIEPNCHDRAKMGIGTMIYKIGIVRVMDGAGQFR